MSGKVTERSAERKEACGDNLPPTPTRPINLRNVEAVRRELQRVYSEARRGTIDPVVASKLVYILSIAAKLLEQGEAEKRLTELEARLAAIKR